MIHVSTFIRIASLISEYNDAHKYRAARILLTAYGIAIEMRDFTTTNLRTYTQHVSFNDLETPVVVFLVMGLIKRMDEWLGDERKTT